MKKVLIGIGTCDNFSYVERNCLDKVFAQTYKNFDVLLVDNSKGKTHFMKLLSQFPKANVIHIDRAPYFRDALREVRQYIKDYAVNHGYEYLFFVDIDHLLQEDSLEKLIKHNKDFVTGAIGYLHRDDSTCFIRDFTIAKPSFVPGMYPCKCITWDEMKFPPFFTEIHGCGLSTCLIKTKVLFGMNFYVCHKQAAFMEDMIFCGDLHNKGVKLFLDKTVRPFHLHVMMSQRAFRDPK